MGLFSKKTNDQNITIIASVTSRDLVVTEPGLQLREQYQEGDIVAYQDDTFRVRRNYGEQLELVNNTGYHLVNANETEETYYCGHCSAFVAISRGLHPHGKKG